MKRRVLVLAAMLPVLVCAPTGRADEPVTLRTVKAPAENRKDEPWAKAFSVDQAVRFMDAAALSWTRTHGCFSCHSNLSYLYARPSVAADVPAHGEVRHALEEMVSKRWAKEGPRWDAEVVVSAAALAFNDAATTRKLHPLTKAALDRMWTIQRQDGGWSWYKCNWPPMEYDDHYGVTLAAIAVGVAPENYAKTEAARKGLDGIRRYLKANPPRNAHHRAMLLWASSYLADLQSDAERRQTVKELRALQRPDGGWSAAGLGSWKRSDKLQQDPSTSDGYGTGFVIYVLRRAGVPADDPALQKGVAWLKNNQRESGRWFTRSLNRDNKHYLTHAGTAFAVMALASCAEKGPTAAGR
jgi:squalene-hopene/tetraprenyl-beta-curcumene cyclase